MKFNVNEKAKKKNLFLNNDNIKEIFNKLETNPSSLSYLFSRGDENSNDPRDFTTFNDSIFPSTFFSSPNLFPTFVVPRRRKKKVKFLFDRRQTPSIEELKKDIEKEHGYLLISPDPFNKEKFYKDNCISTSINTRILLRILETRHFNAKKIPQTFIGNIKVLLNNMRLPKKGYYIPTKVKRITNIQYANDGNNCIATNTLGHTQIFKYNNIKRRFVMEKKIMYDNDLFVEDILISQDRYTFYFSHYPGKVYKIDCPNLEERNNYSIDDFIIYISDSQNSNNIKKICFKDKDEDFLICGSGDGNVYGYDMNQSQLAFKVKSHYCVKDICMLTSTNCNVFISSGRDHLNIYDSRILSTNIDSGFPIAIIMDNGRHFNRISSRGDGNYIVGMCNNESVRVYDVRYPDKYIIDTEDDCTTEGLGYIGGINTPGTVICDTCKVKFSPPHTGSRYIYTGVNGGNVVIFDLYTGLKVKTFQCKGLKIISSLDWHPFKNEIVVGGIYGKVICISDEDYPRHIVEDYNESNNPPLYIPILDRFSPEN